MAGREITALRQGHWKFIDGEPDDLENDLAEMHDLSAKMPEKAKAMAVRLGELMRRDDREK